MDLNSNWNFPHQVHVNLDLDVRILRSFLYGSLVDLEMP